MPWKRLFQLIIVLLGLGLLLDLASRLGAELLWFREVAYLSVFLLKFQVRLRLLAVVTGFTAIYLLGNLALAERLKYLPDSPAFPPSAKRRKPLLSPYNVTLPLLSQPFIPSTGALRLRSLLPLTLALSILVGLLLVDYGQLAVNYWQDGTTLSSPLVSRLNPKSLWQTMTQLSGQVWLLSGVLGSAIALLIYPRFLLRAIAVTFSILFGWLLSKQWAVVLQSLHPTLFNSAEPLFGHDISFYIFALPLWELVELWLFGLFLYGFVAVALTYLLSEGSLSQGSFPGFSSVQQRHLCGVGSGLMSTIALSCWLSRYKLLYSQRGVAFGASYTDVVAQLPAYTALSLLALAIALYLLWHTVFWQPKAPYQHWLSLSFGLFGILIVAGTVVPEIIQFLVVQPNELAREGPFIERTIALTRQAFGLEVIESSNFNPQGQLTEATLAANDLTIRNIRLWDQRPLLETNRQLQQIRPYYRFPDADIDRYTLQSDVLARPPATPQARPAPNASNASTEQRQVLIAARELDYSAVPQEAKTWVNRHLIYTHGYGFTLSPVNTAGTGGLPDYFVKDITGGEAGALTTSSPAIRAGIPIGQPRIYYGEIPNTYVMTQTLTQELDYPTGSDNAYNVYDGRGGINMGSWWRRSLFAVYLRDWRLLVTRDFLPETKVLFRRSIKHRIQAIAPFLRYDSDPYLVTANVQTPEPNDQNYLYWIVDAYTTSDRYPYSDLGSEGINYIRNSVKVVIDAYHGSVDFYVADPSDPIITTWSKIFPNLFQRLTAMPASLRSHLRYPVDFFKLQSERLMTYHMTDPQVFYNREDQWQIPNEVYGNESRSVEPYYLITSLPAVPFEEFILLLPYTPRQRTNLIAWLAARSDGENYGKLLLYTFPKERLVYGPEQIEARINQDPVISQQISLWNRQGSRAVQGNLLIVPIEQSLLYVEPLYLEAAQNSLPTLVRVIVVYENRIVMSPTLEEALQAIFKPQATPDATIIRPVEEPTTGQ
ncbi:UPF0182 family protein [Phormidium sp. FACHB-592]|uniref:UPF0182 protein NDI38_27890 n=1 Tax=Stenomitos frigidus AS-A4 TaxID=2933935 RepID=A0ABV0KSK6_9CYAN|nr:UPF0182 family protein [Phormidium sp. FACHB-592]MBD2075582.1 UPF0182 family protein [Phormidium sp. FACHB-592]